MEALVEYLPILVTIGLFLVGQIITGLIFATRISTSLGTRLDAFESVVKEVRDNLKETTTVIVNLEKRVIRLEVLFDKKAIVDHVKDELSRESA